MIRVLLVDDDPLVCAHLRTILDTADDMEVVGDAYDGADALDAVTRHQPDVVLMDLRMPGIDGITVTSTRSASGRSWSRSPPSTPTSTSCGPGGQGRPGSC